MKVGIVGLPNAGKSTIFNALTSLSVPAEAYPFCTVEPNTAAVEVEDSRLDFLYELVKPEEKIPATINIVDIAGLVRGASKGEGLGNRFLSHIRNVDAIAHVLRAFSDSSVSHIEGRPPDPVKDAEIVNTELILADLEQIERAHEQAIKAAKSGARNQAVKASALEKIMKELQAGRPARFASLSAEEMDSVKSFSLLTAKPVIYVLNIDESSLPDGPAEIVPKFMEMARNERAETVILSGKLESELAKMNEDEREAFLREYSLDGSALQRFIRKAYHLMGLISFFTVEGCQVRAWTVEKGTRAQKAAGKIHSDIERGFIRAEVTTVPELKKYGSFKSVQEHGALRLEGKDYEVQDGDVIYFRFNV